MRRALALLLALVACAPLASAQRLAPNYETFNSRTPAQIATPRTGQYRLYIDAGTVKVENPDGSTTSLSAGASISVLNDLTDVTITAAASGDYLRHNGTVWVDSTIQAADVAELLAVTDLSTYASASGTGTAAIRATVTSLASNDVLTWNGTNWVNQAPAGGLSGLSTGYAQYASSSTALAASTLYRLSATSMNQGSTSTIGWANTTDATAAQTLGLGRGQSPAGVDALQIRYLGAGAGGGIQVGAWGLTGVATSPSYTFINDTDTGFFQDNAIASGRTGYASDGIPTVGFQDSGLWLRADRTLRWDNGTGDFSAADLYLGKDGAANTLQMGVDAGTGSTQTLKGADATTAATKGGTFRIGGGNGATTGTGGDTIIGYYPASSDTFTAGLTLSATLITSTLGLQLPGAGTAKLYFGGTTSSFPALDGHPSEVTLRVVLGDSSAYARLNAHSLRMIDSGVLAWGSNASIASLDTGMVRHAAAAVRATDGSTGVGSILGARLTSAKATAYTVLTTDSNISFTNEGATASVTFTLPSAAASLGPYTFTVQDADGIAITAGSGDTIRIAAVVTAAAGSIDSTTIGDSVTLVAINATEWVAIYHEGTGF